MILSIVGYASEIDSVSLSTLLITSVPLANAKRPRNSVKLRIKRMVQVQALRIPPPGIPTLGVLTVKRSLVFLRSTSTIPVITFAFI